MVAAVVVRVAQVQQRVWPPLPPLPMQPLRPPPSSTTTQCLSRPGAVTIDTFSSVPQAYPLKKVFDVSFEIPEKYIHS